MGVVNMMGSLRELQKDVNLEVETAGETPEISSECASTRTVFGVRESGDVVGDMHQGKMMNARPSTRVVADDAG
ncbi:hypothetical protein GCM10027572_11190 [Flexivirga lutea]